MKKLVFEGAEARTYLTEFLGKKAIEKKRIPKKYRQKELDEKIRFNRARDETNLMHKAKLAGVRTPAIYRIDRKKCIILMELIKAKKMAQAVNSMKKKDFIETGKQIALLHLNSIIHGDLTTNNLLIKKGKIFFIDFGLGFNSGKTEDCAVDLLGFKRTFLSSCPEKTVQWKQIEQGYKMKGKKEVLERMLEVEKRARYL